MNDVLLTLRDGLIWLAIALWIGAAVAAVFRFRGTPSGVLFAVGIGLQLSGAAATKIFYGVDRGTITDVDAYISQLVMLYTVRGSLYILGWITLAIAIGFIPYSHRRIAQRRNQSAPGVPM